MKSYKDYPYDWITLTADGFSLSTSMHFDTIMSFYGYCYIKKYPEGINNAELVKIFNYLQDQETKATLELRKKVYDSDKDREKKTHNYRYVIEYLTLKDIKIESPYTIYYNGKEYTKGSYSYDSWYGKDEYGIDEEILINCPGINITNYILRWKSKE